METTKLTAKAIRTDLKKSFPTIKFSVTSERSTVRVSYTDGVPTEQVEKVISKYEMGSFDGMDDSYKYTNRREDIPQVRYLFVDRVISDEAREATAIKLLAEANMQNVFPSHFVVLPNGEYLSTMIHRTLYNQTIS